MLGSTILDVAIGLVFVFMAVSLAASALTEALSSFIKLRQTTLRSGIQALLNDADFTGLARDLYNHALVNPLARGTATGVADLTASPAYVDSSCFALALLSILEKPAAGVPLATTVAKIQDEQLKQALTTLLSAAGDDRAAFLNAVGRWFDDAMDRLGGWYKRYTQVIGFAMALLVCAVLNADALRVGTALLQKPSLVAELSVADVPEASKVIETLNGTALIGWSGVALGDWGADLSMVLGWLIVAGASLFGAPFWFDMLQRVVRLAGTGPTGDKATAR